MIRSLLVYTILGIIGEIIAQKWIKENTEYISSIEELKKIKKNIRISVFIVWFLVSTAVDRLILGIMLKLVM